MEKPNVKNYLEYDLVAEMHGVEAANALSAAITVATHCCIGSVSSVAHSLGQFHMVVARAIFGHLSHESDIIERAATIMEDDGAEPDENGVVPPGVWQDAMQKARAEYQEFLEQRLAEGLSEDEVVGFADEAPTKH